MTPRAALCDAFIARNGWAGARRVTVAGDASNRRYDRLLAAQGHSVILMDAPPERGEDVRLFIRIANYLRDLGLSAPQIFAADQNAGFLLIEDLGDALFADLMAQDPARQSPLYRAAVDVLRVLHRADPLDLPVCDAAWLTEMTGPLFDWYAPDASLKEGFETAFRPLAARLESAPKVVILRDYHAQNLLSLPHRTGVAAVGVLDFQDALLGHPAYDLVSVLQDARRDVPESIETEMITQYIATAETEPAAFQSAYALLGLQRNLRILGIFARLCLRDAKPGYIDLIPRVWRYVQRNLRHPDLAEVTQVLAPLPAPTPSFLESLKSRCPASP